MTILVFNSGILTITTPAWCATAMEKNDLVQVHVLGAPIRAQANLRMGLLEFLAMVADGGKIVDLRLLQEFPRETAEEMARRVLNASPAP